MAKNAMLPNPQSGGIPIELGGGTYPFPKDNLPIEVKESAEWHNLVAWAIWKNNRSFGSTFFYNDRENYRRYIRYALGKNSPTEYAPFLGVDPNANDKTWLRAINWEIKNYFTKRMNILISKMLSQEYDAEVTSIDPVAVSQKQDIKAKLELYDEFKDWFNNISEQTGADVAPVQGLSMDVLPSGSEERDLFLSMDYKTAEELGMELGIRYHLKRNKYAEYIKPEVAFDISVLGVGAIYVGMDENVMPEMKRFNPSDLIVPYMTHPNFTEAPYIAGIIWFTAGEFRKHATGYLPDDQIEEVIKNFSKKPDRQLNYTENLIHWDDVNRIPVLLYNYRSTDTEVYVTKEDEYGNKSLYKKPFDYYARPKEVDKFVNKYGKSRKLYRKEYNTVYEGFWVINSNVIYRQGRRSFSMRKRGNLGEDLMGFKIFAPNSWNGYIVGIAQQAIPILDELQRYNLKIQQLVARAIPKGIGIDLYALSKANLKWNGKALSDQEKIEMFVKSGLFIFSSEDRYAPGSNYKPFVSEENGLGNDIEKYLELTQAALNQLDEVIGLNKVSAASSLPEDQGKGVSMLQNESTDVSLDYLYRSMKTLEQEVVETTGMLHIQSVRYGPQSYYDRIFGPLKSGLNYSSLAFNQYDYGFNISPSATKQQWAELIVDAKTAYQAGALRYSDILFLQQLAQGSGSLKHARRYLMMIERKRANESQQNSIDLQQANASTQNQSIMAKLQADKELSDYQTQNELKVKDFDRQTQIITKNLEYDNDARLHHIDGSIESIHIQQQGNIEKDLEKMASKRPASNK